MNRCHKLIIDPAMDSIDTAAGSRRRPETRRDALADDAADRDPVDGPSAKPIAAANKSASGEVMLSRSCDVHRARRKRDAARRRSRRCSTTRIC